MSNFTITAGDVISSVMADGQVQTTNRTALLDYVNRTSLRILRESQWQFLKSDVQKFITEPGAADYWVASGQAPPGCVDSGLKLPDVASVLPESVFDLTHGTKLTQDSALVRNQQSFLYQDGSLRYGYPKAYTYAYSKPGVLSVFPLPDNQNLYYPVPSSPLCTFISGGSLGIRNYYVVATFVDSFGNEGTPSIQPTVIALQPANLLQVQSPDPEIKSSNLTTYNSWNVYVGTTYNGPFYRQNMTPIPIGANWIETPNGFSQTVIAPALSFPLVDPTSTLWNIGVTTSGLLQGVQQDNGYLPAQFFIADSNNLVRLLEVDTNGNLLTNPAPGNIPQLPIMLQDSSGMAWEVVVTTNGLLQTISKGTAASVTVPTNTPPTKPTLAPIFGYVIAFRYQQQRKVVTVATDILQIPFQYFDVVVAGVNYYANLYTAKADDINIKASIWKKEFMDGLAQIRRDLRINYRDNDVLMPDRQFQYKINGESWYFGTN